jgi:hypothetical protein
MMARCPRESASFRATDGNILAGQVETVSDNFNNDWYSIGIGFTEFFRPCLRGFLFSLTFLAGETNDSCGSAPRSAGVEGSTDMNPSYRRADLAVRSFV